MLNRKVLKKQANGPVVNSGVSADNLIRTHSYTAIGERTMIGMIGAVAVLVWYFYSAERVGKNSAGWAIAGALIYAGTRWAWTLGVVRPIMGRGFYSHSATTGFMIETSAIVVALVVIVIVKLKFLSGPKVSSPEN